MPRKTRLANKTIWAIEDIAAAAHAARALQQKAVRRAEAQLDAVMLATLARLGNELAEIEQLSISARHGDYVPPTAG